MAAIAKFVSFDGGIAFSERSLKIQKRDADNGRVVQLSEIAEMRVSEPLFGDDGSIGILFRGERRISEANTIYFDETQYEEAVRFKVAFDGVVADSKVELPPLEMFSPNVPARREPVRRAMQPAVQQKLGVSRGSWHRQETGRGQIRTKAGSRYSILGEGGRPKRAG